MTDIEKRVANRLRQDRPVLAQWVPFNDNPTGRACKTQVRRIPADDDYEMTGWPNGDLGEYVRRFASAEEAAEAFVGTVGSTLARRAMASGRQRRGGRR